jgi:uncharacterized membrane protein
LKVVRFLLDRTEVQHSIDHFTKQYYFNLEDAVTVKKGKNITKTHFFNITFVVMIASFDV